GPQGLVELIVYTAPGPPPPARRRATAPRQWSSGAHPDRVPTRQGDQLEPVAQVQVSGDDGPHRVERRPRPRQHDEAGTNARPIDDSDAYTAVDGGGVLGDGRSDGRTDGQKDHHTADCPDPKRHRPTVRRSDGPTDCPAPHCLVPEK